MNPNKIQLKEQIGHGSFSTVHKALDTEKNRNVAVKIINLDNDKKIQIEDVHKEIIIVSSLRHPNIINIYESFINKTEIWIVMPYAIGSVKQVLHEIAPNGFRDETLMATILRETLKGLDYIHKEGLVHRDIKADNILMFDTGEIKIADFGIVGTLKRGNINTNCKTFTGTVCWMSPEVAAQNNGYNYKTDIWSLGITALEIAYGQPPYYDFGGVKSLLFLLQEEPPTFKFYEEKSSYSNSFVRFVDKCLKKDPLKRVNPAKLLESKFIKKAKTGIFDKNESVEYIKNIVKDVEIKVDNDKIEKMFKENFPLQDPVPTKTWKFN